jgi:hypothetical protein
MVCRSNRQRWNSSQGKMMNTDDPRACSCGSGNMRRAVYDGYNIFLTFVCDECYERKISKFRPDIFEQYTTEEPIEPD